MSGVAAIFDFSGPSCVAEELYAMVARISHRGSRGSGVWSDVSVGIGQLFGGATHEDSLDVSPQVEVDDRLVIAADARLDNRTDLARRLGLLAELEHRSDAFLIREAFRRLGNNATDFIDGDFAILVWDRMRHELTAIRDHIGIKPLYYTRTGSRLYVASEVKALLAVCGEKEIDTDRINSFISGQETRPHSTAYKDVWAIPPAALLTADRGGSRIERYWTLTVDENFARLDPVEAAIQARDILSKSVAARMRSSGRIGVHVSGGLDSSAIATLAIRSKTEAAGLEALSVIYERLLQCDEREYIEAVISATKLPVHYVYGDSVGPLAYLDEIWEYEDDACVGGNYFLVSLLARRSAALGHSVVLDGLDGDTVVWHGIERLNELALLGRWRSIGNEIEALLRQGNDISPIILARILKTLVRSARGSSVSEVPALLRLLVRCRKYVGSRAAASLMRDVIFASASGGQVEGRRRLESVREAQYSMLHTPTFTRILEMTEREAAHRGFEARHPFLAKDVVQFFYSLDSSVRLRDGWFRWVLRQSMNGTVPSKVVWRANKAMMGENFVDGLLRRNPDKLNALVVKAVEFSSEVPLLASTDRLSREVLTSLPHNAPAIGRLWRHVVVASWLARKLEDGTRPKRGSRESALV